MFYKSDRMTPYASREDRMTKTTHRRMKTRAEAILMNLGPPSSPPPKLFCRLRTRMAMATMDSMKKTVTEKPREPIGTENLSPWYDQ